MGPQRPDYSPDASLNFCVLPQLADVVVDEPQIFTSVPDTDMYGLRVFHGGVSSEMQLLGLYGQWIVG